MKGERRDSMNVIWASKTQTLLTQGVRHTTHGLGIRIILGKKTVAELQPATNDSPSKLMDPIGCCTPFGPGQILGIMNQLKFCNGPWYCFPYASFNSVTESTPTFSHTLQHLS